MRWFLPLLLVAVAHGEDTFTSADPAARLRAVATLAQSPAGVPLLIDLLDDDDEGVRRAATQALVALGRKGLAVHANYLAGPKSPGFHQIGRTALALGAALTPADLASAMEARHAAADKQAGAASSLAAAFPWEFVDPMLDVLADVASDPGAGELAGASLSILGWGAVAKDHPATEEEAAAHVKLLTTPAKKGEEWTPAIAGCAVALVVPRERWPKEIHQYPWAWEEERDDKRPPLTDLQMTLGKLAQSAPGNERDYERRGKFEMAVRALRSYGPKAAPLEEDILKLLRKERELQRVELAGVLCVVSTKHRDAAAKELGARLLHRKDHWVRYRAQTLLTELGPGARPAVPALTAVLDWPEDDDGDGKDLAAQFARMGAEFFKARLVKRAVASLLGRIGPGAADARRALLALRKHEDDRLRYRVALALRRIG